MNKMDYVNILRWDDLYFCFGDGMSVGSTVEEAKTNYINYQIRKRERMEKEC